MPHQRVARVFRRVKRRVVTRIRQVPSAIVTSFKRDIGSTIKNLPALATRASLFIPATGLGAAGVVRVGAPVVARGGVVGTVGGFIKGVGAKVQKFGKPVTFKTGIRTVGSRTLKGLGITTGITAISSAITGEPFNPLSRRAILGSLGFGVGGLPAAAVGGAFGLGKVGIREAGDIINLVKDRGGVPDIPAFPAGGFEQPSNVINFDFGDAPAAPPVGGNVSGGGFAPGGVSFNVGGGGADLSTLMLLLLLGVGGVGLTGLFRKRKKKKKKKKRKKLKRKLRELDEDE